MSDDEIEEVIDKRINRLNINMTEK